MKNGVANIWITGMVVTFIFLMSAYIATTISYMNTYKMKNEVLGIIERHHGITSAKGKEIDSKVGSGKVIYQVGTLQTINLYLRGSGYSSYNRGYCPTGDNWYGATLTFTDTDFDDSFYSVATNSGATVDNAFTGSSHTTVEKAVSGRKYNYCFAKYYNSDITSGVTASYYYRVRLFYSFNVPILSTFIGVRADGVTKVIYNITDNGMWDTATYGTNSGTYD